MKTCIVCGKTTERKWKEFIVCDQCLDASRSMIPEIKKIMRESGNFGSCTLRDAINLRIKTRRELIRKLKLGRVQKVPYKVLDSSKEPQKPECQLLKESPNEMDAKILNKA